MRRAVQAILVIVALTVGIFVGIEYTAISSQVTGGAENVFPTEEVSLKGAWRADREVVGQIQTVEQIQEIQAARKQSALAYVGNKAGEVLRWVSRKTVIRFAEIVDKLTSRSMN